MEQKLELIKTPIYGRVLLWVGVFVFVFALTGCSKAFADNPVYQNIQNGKNDFDFSLFSVESSVEDTESSAFEKSLEERIPADKLEIFNHFINQVKNAKNLSYTRVLSFSEQEPTANTNLEKFLISSQLLIIEEKDLFVMDSIDTNQRLFYDGAYGYLVDKADKTEESTLLGKKDKRHLLYYICNDSKLELLSTDTEVVGEETYLIFNLTENSQIAKWYFDSNDRLFLRMFLDDELLYAIKYDDIKMDIEVDKNIFDLRDLDIPLNEELTPSRENPDEENKAVSAQTPADQPVSNPLTPKTNENSESAKVPEATYSIPKSTENSSSAVVKPPTGSGAESSAPPGGTNLESQGDVLPKIVEPKAPIKEYDNRVVEKGQDSTNIKNYPHKIVPLIFGYNITSSSEDLKNEQRTIYLKGTLEGSASGAAYYYEDILEGTPRYRFDENYNGDAGMTYYTLRGWISGWDVNIEITEDHNTSTRTMAISVTK